METWKEIDFEQDRTRSDMDSASSSGAAGANETPSWAKLNPDALAEIFCRVPFEDRMRTLPLVCKGWRNASSYPACWRYLDMLDWFQKRAEKDYLWEFESESAVENVIMKAVDKSCGQLRLLRTKNCSDAAINYIADRSVVKKTIWNAEMLRSRLRVFSLVFVFVLWILCFSEERRSFHENICRC